MTMHRLCKIVCAVVSTAGLALLSPALSADVPSAAQDGNVAFAAPPSYVSEDKFGDYSVTDDGKAFQVTFNALEIGAKGGALATPVVSRVFSIVVPFSGGEPTTTLPIKFDGSVVLEPGAHGTAIFSINGQSTTLALEPGKEDSYLTTLNFAPHGAKEARITVILLMAREKDSKASGYLNLNVIGTDTFVPKKK